MDDGGVDGWIDEWMMEEWMVDEWMMEEWMDGLMNG